MRSLILTGLTLLTLMFAAYWLSLQPVQRKAVSFETNLLATVDPLELQRWGTVFMREHSVAWGEAVTNAPDALTRLSSFQPHAIIVDDEGRYGRHLVLHWSRTLPSLLIGEAEFEVPTNSHTIMLTKGVYLRHSTPQ